jgi:hypothetical protein
MALFKHRKSHNAIKKNAMQQQVPVSESHNIKPLDPILNFIDSDITTGALLLTGSCGSGKTWYITHTLRDELKDQKRPLSVVSLFGIDTPDQFNRALKRAYLGINHGDKKSVKATGEKIKNTVDNIPILAQFIPSAETILDLIRLPKNTVLIFDDLERCAMNIEVTLGLINEYVENNENKTIIIAYEDIIKDDKYKTIKEKVISKTILYS